MKTLLLTNGRKLERHDEDQNSSASGDDVLGSLARRLGSGRESGTFQRQLGRDIKLSRRLTPSTSLCTESAQGTLPNWVRSP